ncbi:asparagine synthase (glutamine-hydrolyzing) [Niveispirillum lacus]|uniref:asparagine synthase (glutamine-hydrolyzing) n=1 Tax=Niveispirillum lacus TaxID=1981099 RepID=A0A255Z5U1_9PROT|nr:asparagine synthase (glutamine-hydrolyzing) [Niveispirillum lacus]OYQ36913.1 asparagine synthase (glutamine-hydrolyzing) [Niveispirillum lacus]
MCGIAGFINAELGPQALVHLLDSMVTRGPDGAGIYHDGPIHMGMRRLSVIDLPQGGQPLFGAHGQVVAFQNGEIYNHRSLRRELEAAGYQFVTASDTEVLAHGFCHWSIEGLLARLDGMFAIAILDRTRGELHLARDRFGEKPLFFAAADSGFGYGSTMLAVAALPWVTGEPDPLAVDRYLALHHVPGDQCFLRGVQQLLPGERLVVRLADLSVRRARYYRPPLRRTAPVDDRTLAGALERAVSSRLIADVPVGVFLSGGLDSSLVAAIAARQRPRIDTFSMGFGDPLVDESAHAAALARAAGTTHHAFTFDNDHFLTLVPEVAAALDVPLGDQALLPVYWLSREARRHVTVVLSGEGADEVFAGYGYYASVSPQTVPGWSQRLRNRITPATLPAVAPLLDEVTLATPSGFPLLSSAATRHYLTGRTGVQPDGWEIDLRDWLALAKDPLQRATAAEIATWLPDDLLVKLDRMTMAHGLEGRAPFLAPELVEMGLNLPAHERRLGGVSKRALRRVARLYLPPALLDRPKQGFVLPMEPWLRQWFAQRGGPQAYFTAGLCAGLHPTAAAHLVSDELGRGNPNVRLLFALVMLVEWARAFQKKCGHLSRLVRGS